jgi:parvulin-like peptidyl-prolyl isomerase
MKHDEPYEKLMRRGLAAAAVLGLLIALIAATPADRARLSDAGAIAKVNDRHIDRTAYVAAYQALLSDKSKAPTANDKKRVLNRLIEEELLVQRGLEIGLLDGDASVRKAVAMAVMEFVLAQGGSDALSENSLRTYYEENKNFFAPANRLQVAQIFIPYGETPDDAAVIAQLDKVRAALRRGDDFAATALALGTEILPALPRVMLTPAKMTDYLGPELTAAAARLPQGSISDALAGPTGWHFFKIIRNQPGRPPAFEDVRGQIIDALRRDNDDDSLRDYLAWLQGRADIVLAPDAPH